MAEILHLHGNAHEQAQLLLPWYVNKTLESGDRARVDAHLAQCEVCREDLAAEQKLARYIVALPIDGQASWTAVKDRIRPRRGTRRTIFDSRQRVVGWAIGGPVAAAAAVLLGVGLTQGPTAPEYHALGNRQAAPRGNLIVMFQPNMPEARLRDALTASGARLVDGPTFGGAYVLWVNDAARPDALRRLRDNPDVTLAEPIGPGSVP